MSPETWQRLKEIHGAALDLPPGQREEFLTRSCGGDAGLLAELRALLAQEESPVLDSLQPSPAALRHLHEARHTFLPGETLNNRFRIERFIGEGGMGEVFEATDLEANERIALKSLRQGAMAGDREVAALRREMQLARRITHPNVCRIHGIERLADRGLLFITMELLSGETLAARLASSGALPTTEALPLIRQIAAGVAAAHAAGVIHRDLKPGNVMLHFGRAVITDFGLAKSFEQRAGTGSLSTEAVMGTPDYMAPEAVEGGRASVAADIYSLGVMMYQLVTGQLPFAAANPLAAAMRKARERATPPGRLVPGVPAVLESVILRALDPEPAARFLSADALLAALDGGVVPASPRALARGLRRPILAGLAAALVFAAALWLWNNRSYRPTAASGRDYAEGVQALHDGAPLKASRLLARATAADPRHVLAHARLAEAWMDLDQPDQAKDALLQASALYPAQVKLAARDRQLLAALQAVVRREFSEAARGFRALGLAFDTARALENNGQSAPALAAYRALGAADSAFAAAHLRQGVLEARVRQLDPALASFDRAASAYSTRLDVEGEIETLIQRAIALRAAGRFDPARAALTDAHSRSATPALLHRRIAVVFLQATVEIAAGSPQRVPAAIGPVIEEAHRRGEDSLLVSAWHELGNAWLLQINLDEADVAYIRSLELARRGRYRLSEARVLTQLANLRMRQSRALEANGLIDRATAYFAQAGYPRQLSQAQSIAIQIKSALGDYAGALALVERQRPSVEAANDSAALALLHENRAYNLSMQGELAEAAKLYGEAARGHSAANRPLQESYSRVNRAEMLARLPGQLAEAEAELARPRELSAKLDAGFRARLAEAEALLALSGHRCAAAAGFVKSLPPSASPARRARESALAARVELCRGNRAAASAIVAKALAQPEAAALPPYARGQLLALRAAAAGRPDPEADKFNRDFGHREWLAMTPSAPDSRIK